MFGPEDPQLGLDLVVVTRGAEEGAKLVEESEVEDHVEEEEDEHGESHSEVEAGDDDKDRDHICPEVHQKGPYFSDPGILPDQICVVIGLNVPNDPLLVILCEMSVKFRVYD